jgi:competence protein ComEC
MKKVISLILLLALLLCLTGCPPLNKDDPPVTGELKVHFIDVGQADCALIECNGEYILIDGGNVEDSQLVVSYLQKQGVEELLAVVCSHAHEDHVGGLPAVLAVYPTHHVYAPTRTYSSKCFDDFAHYTDQQGLEITIPAPGDYLSFGGATMTVLGPVKSYADPNDTSIVVRIDYGTTSFLFTGDMETQAENDMLEHWGEFYDWHVDVLKVGHHGSETSTGYRFLNAVMPVYGVISVGKDNSYGHPHEAPMSRLEDAEVILYRTDKMGTIIAASNGTDISFTWENGGSKPILPDGSRPSDSGSIPATTYIGNKNSKKLHLPGCSSLPGEENRVTFEDYDKAISEGYTPCSKCLG